MSEVMCPNCHEMVPWESVTDQDCSECSTKAKDSVANHSPRETDSGDELNAPADSVEEKCVNCGHSKSIHTIDIGNCKYCKCKKFKPKNSVEEGKRDESG